MQSAREVQLGAPARALADGSPRVNTSGRGGKATRGTPGADARTSVAARGEGTLGSEGRTALLLGDACGVRRDDYRLPDLAGGAEVPRCRSPAASSS